MANVSTTKNGYELNRQTKIEDLGNETTRLRSPFKHKSYCNSVFTPTSSCSSSGGSGMGTLAYVGIGMAAAATLLPVGAMVMSMCGSQAPQGAGAGQVSSKAVLGTLSNAEDSGDEKTIKTAIEQGKAASKSYDGQINAAQAELDKANADIPAIQGNVDNQKNTEIPKLNNELDGLEQSVKGDKSSKGLTGKRDSEISKVPKTVTEAGPDGKPVTKPNPKYDEEVNNIKQQYEKPIADAKDIEDKQIPAKKDAIKKAEEKLKDLEQQLEKAKEKAEKAKENLDKLKPEKQKIDEKVARLERQLANIQSATKTDGGTAPAAGDTGSTIAANAKLAAEPGDASTDSGDSVDKTLSSVTTGKKITDDELLNLTPASAPSEDTKTDSSDSHSGTDTTPVKKETPENVSFNISNSRTVAQLNALDDEIDDKFGKGSQDSIRLHNEVNNKKLAVSGAGDDTTGPAVTIPTSTSTPGTTPTGSTEVETKITGADIQAVLDRNAKIAELAAKYQAQGNDPSMARTLAELELNKKK